MEKQEKGVCMPLGYLAAGMWAGFKKSKKKDLALVFSVVQATCCGVYTTNKVKGAPLQVTQENLSDGRAQAIIINSGNANTCTENGYEVARKTCSILASGLGIEEKDVVVASTGIIGVPLSIKPFEKNMASLIKGLSEEGNFQAASAILTTDRKTKEASSTIETPHGEIRIGAMAKGSGMINPNMATMLSFFTTDADITLELLKEALFETVETTFNQISIDGDTSTNDMVIIMANGESCVKIRNRDDVYQEFKQGLLKLSRKLCKMIARDGEGATKQITCKVLKAASLDQARLLSKSVISSNLVKAAMFGKDANWGRILCALGYGKTEALLDDVSIVFKSEKGEVKVCENSKNFPFPETLAKEILSSQDVEIRVTLNEGEFEAEAYGCDLTYEYVRINGDYRT